MRCCSRQISSVLTANPTTATTSSTTAAATTARCRRAHLRSPLHQRRPPGPDRLVLQEAAQVVGQLLGRGVALGRVLGHRLEDDRLQLRRDRLVEPPRRPRLLEGDLPQQLLPVAGRRRPARSVSSSYSVAPSE